MNPRVTEKAHIIRSERIAFRLEDMSESIVDENCVFCAIVAGKIPATVVARTDDVIAFEDIHPQAEVHVVVTPTTHAFRNVTELASDPKLLAEMVTVSSQIAHDRAGGQFRLIFNTGERAGQTVFHVHAHVLAGDLSESRLA